MWGNWCCDSGREKPKDSEKDLSLAIGILTCTGLTVHPGLCGKRPEVSRLKDGAEETDSFYVLR